MARRVAVVTGGCQGIGLAAARALQARDYDVIAADVAVSDRSPGADSASAVGDGGSARTDDTSAGADGKSAGTEGAPGGGDGVPAGADGTSAGADGAHADADGPSVGTDGAPGAGESSADLAGLVTMHVDVTSRASVERLAAQVAAEFGRLDCLVTCAGVTGQHPSASVSEESWSRVLATHVDGTFRCCQVFHPLLASSGDASIVTVSSVVARLGLPGRLSYSTAKSAIEGMTRTLAVEWAPDHIRVNAVAPGWTRTPPVAVALDSGLVDEARLTARIPMGRLALAEEVARSIVFLATPDSSYITGQVLVVDGGTSIAIST
jgi:NAD(P)-dependent dehydrogenase (short-subunit alcohol dehydrogenase family)